MYKSFLKLNKELDKELNKDKYNGQIITIKRRTRYVGFFFNVIYNLKIKAQSKTDRQNCKKSSKYQMKILSYTEKTY